MYSREETEAIKREFWITFSKKYPRKWMLYDTKIKDFSFKFYIDNKIAQVIIAIEPKDDLKRNTYFEKILSLKNIIENDYIKNLIFEKNYFLENGKIISKIWVEKTNVSIGNKNCWDDIFSFFYEKMNLLEQFYNQYDDYIKDV